MKFGYILLLVCIIAGAGIATVLFGVDLGRPFGYTKVIYPPQQPLPEASTPVKATPAVKPAISRVRQTPSGVDSAPAPEITQKDSATAGAPTSATETKGTDAYKGAALSIMRLDRGHDIETLVYSQDRGKRVAVVSLKDGKIASGSPSGVAAVADAAAPLINEHSTPLLAHPAETPRTNERATALLTRPAPAPAPVTSAAIPPAAKAPATASDKSDKALAQASAATNPPSKPPVQSNVATTAGTCGEYRDGKLTVKPCSQVPLSTSEWLAKGDAAAPAESAPREKGK